MSEEEKAIETLKEVASDDFDTLGDDISPKMAQNILNVIDKQQNEIEEKRIIIFAGAEKVKQLENEIKDLKETNEDSAEKSLLNDILIKKNYISKDKIKELKEKVEKEMISNPYDFSYMINELLEEK